MQQPPDSPFSSYDPKHSRWKIEPSLNQSEKSLKIVSKFIGMFASKSSQPSENFMLIGRRIGELDEVAQFVLNELQKLQSNLRNKKETLSVHFETYILNALLKEGEQLKIEQQSTPSEQVRLFHRYRAWIEKARPLIEFFSTEPDEEAITNLIITQATESVILIIERDKRIIVEYADQYLNTIEDNRKEFQSRIDEHLREYLEQLDALKHLPSYSSLSEWNNWKEEVDEARLAFFNDALHAIDSFLKKIRFNSKLEIKSDKKKMVLEQIVFLEQEISKFYLKIEGFKNNKKQLEEYRKDLNALDKIYQKFESLKPFPMELEERYERIQEIFNDLYKIFEQ